MTLPPSPFRFRGPLLRPLLALACGTALTAPGEIVLIDPESADPPGMISAKMLPPKPEAHVLDPTGLLSPEQSAELSVALSKAAAQGIVIHTAFLDGETAVEREKLGNELVHRWTPTDAEIGVLVLSLSSGNEEPSVFIRSRLFAESGSDLFATLGRNALAQSFDEPRAYGTSLELATSLPEAFAKIRAVRAKAASLDAVQNKGTRRAAPPANESKPEIVVSHWDLFVARIDPRMLTLLRTLALGMGGLVLLAATLVVMHLRRPRYFPQVEFRRRFSAPHSGGNNARVSTARPEPLVRVPHA